MKIPLVEIMEWLKTRNKKRWVFYLAAPVVIYLLAVQAMEKRKARELAEQTHELDEKLPGVKLIVNRDDSWVVYQNGTKILADGMGIVGVTWQDAQEQPKLFAIRGLDEKDYPLVVFFNKSGFDISGDVVTARRAADGSIVAENTERGRKLRHAVANRSGGFTLYWDVADQPKVTISDEEWQSNYVGMKKVPTPEELDKMTDEELSTFGLKRVTRDDLIKSTKSGVKGRAFKILSIGGVAVTGTAHVFRGRIEPFAKFDPKDQRLVDSTSTDKDGNFVFPLPAGTYTIVIEHNGIVRGVPLLDGSWAETIVKDEWVDLGFRVTW